MYKNTNNKYEYTILGGKKINRIKVFKYLFFNEIIFSSNNLLIYLILPFLTGKITLILHDHKIRYKANFREKLIIWLFHVFKFRFNKVIIHNKTDIESINLLKYKKIHYLKMPPHGMPNISESTNRQKFNYRTPIKILCFGRIEKYKNFEYMAKLVSLCENHILTIAGSGQITKELNDIIKSSNNIEIINKYISDDELIELMNNHHYLALPYNDITQTGLIELAGYFNKPLILSDIPEFKKIENFNFGEYIYLNNKNKSILVLNKLAKMKEITYQELCYNSNYYFIKKMKDWDTYIKEIIG